MRTTFYDRVAAMLLALLILFGTSVAVLLGLWLSTQVFGRTLAVPVVLVPYGDGSGTGDRDEVNLDVADPGMEIYEDETPLLESLEAVVDIVSDNPAMFSESVPDDSLLIPGGRYGDGRTRGAGTGSTGRVRRWEVNLRQDASVDEYAKMLDFFGIELGILKPGGKVVYVAQLSAAKPAVREGDSVDENRYYLTWLKGDSENADRELLDKAGVEHSGKLIIKFLPEPLEKELAAQEQAFAKERLNDVSGSFFRVDRVGEEYRFVLYNQLYR